jgi:hypothetical protein
VTLRLLKDLEREAIVWGAERLRIPGDFPQVGPHNVLGIEINPYARELAGVSIWIGHIQWMLDHGYGPPTDPVLQPLDNIELRDAILARDAEGAPVPATWPDAEFVVGNPPFLGTGMRLRSSLGDAYIEALRAAWNESVAGAADLVCYWHEMARRQIAVGATRRVGLLATNSIRGGANRHTLARIKKSGDIFMAWSDEPWIVEGAAVRVAIVAQDDGSEDARTLDGESVPEIHPDLTAGADLTGAHRLAENGNIAHQGDKKGGAFDIPGDIARTMLALPTNINDRPNADVVVPWVNGLDLTRRPRDMFIIDFGVERGEAQAAAYEGPFAHLEQHVRPTRARNRHAETRDIWWQHERARPEMRALLADLPRFIATPRVGRHRLFVWLEAPTLPDSALIVIARDDDYAFGVLHSRAHELWSLRMGTWLGAGNDPRYTHSSTFETFPFPWPLDSPDEALSDEQRAHRDAIAEAARARRGAPALAQPARAGPRGARRGALAPPAPAPRRRGRRARAQAPHAHQPLQRAPHLARPPPRHPRRGGIRVVRVGGGALGAGGGGAAGEAAGAEFGAGWVARPFWQSDTINSQRAHTRARDKACTMNALNLFAYGDGDRVTRIGHCHYALDGSDHEIATYLKSTVSTDHERATEIVIDPPLTVTEFNLLARLDVGSLLMKVGASPDAAYVITHIVNGEPKVESYGAAQFVTSHDESRLEERSFWLSRTPEASD